MPSQPYAGLVLLSSRWYSATSRPTMMAPTQAGTFRSATVVVCCGRTGTGREDTEPMSPIQNDSKTEQDAIIQEDASDGSESIPAESVHLPMGSAILSGDTRVCCQCKTPLTPIGYGEWYGWSHPPDVCAPDEEEWSRWSIGWAARLSKATHGEVGGFDLACPGPSLCTANGSLVLLRTASPRTHTRVQEIESAVNGKLVWVWEAASKAIFLNSDGHLHVYGKGRVLSEAKAPVLLDFGPGFITKDGVFESRVAHILQTKESGGHLYIKCRWLSHGQAIEEINTCSPKLFGSTESSPDSTKSSEQLARADSVQLP